MKLRSHLALVTVTSFAVLLAGPAGIAQADRGHDDDHGHAARADTKVFTLDPSTHGNPEGVAWDHDSGAFFVGATGDGTIYRGTLDDPTATEFITFPASAGRSSVGMKVRDGLLYVAGGATGNIYVYDLATKATVATFATGSGGFLNDLVVTPRGDVYVTDSFRPTIWHVTDAQVQAGTGTPGAISVAPDIAFVAGAFNLNGIVALEHGKDLLVIDSATGGLFRVALTHDRAAARSITEVSGLGDSLLGGDGMIVDRGRLVVVIGSPATLKFVKLKHHRTRGEVRDVRTDATLKGPSTVARADDRYLVVNADFATSTTPFTVSGLSRHGGDDHSGHGSGNSGHGSGHGSGHSGHSG